MYRLSYNTWRRGLFRLCVLLPSSSSSRVMMTCAIAPRRTTAGPSFVPKSRRGYSNSSTSSLSVCLSRHLLPHPSQNRIPSSAFIQNVLLLVIASPTVIAATHPSPLTRTDGVLALTALALLAWEFTADNQQFAYHAWKHGKYDEREHWPGARLAWTEDDAARGFCTRGLWSWSRHPNFFAEQSFWVRLHTLSPIHPASSFHHSCLLLANC
jgi:Protein of unknown function (DUF1295)